MTVALRQEKNSPGSMVTREYLPCFSVLMFCRCAYSQIVPEVGIVESTFGRLFIKKKQDLSSYLHVCVCVCVCIFFFNYPLQRVVIVLDLTVSAW